MSFEHYIARRYLFSRERGALVTVITIISILGVAIGVCALVTVIAVLDGADEDLFRKMIDVDAHIEIAAAGPSGISNYGEVAAAIEEIPGVVGVAPAIVRPAAVLIQSQTTGEIVPRPMAIFGADLDREAKVTHISQHITPPQGEPQQGEILLGYALARSLGKTIGDDIRVVTNFGSFAGRMMPMYRDLKIVGTLRTDLYDYDSTAALVSLEQAQRLFLLDEDGEPIDAVTNIRISVEDPFHIEPLYDAVIRVVSPLLRGQSANVDTWQTKNMLFFNALKLEKIMLFLILLLIIIVAAFNIIGTQILVVLQKTREVGILMSMGVPRFSIMRIFFSYGLTIGGLGTLVGVIGGLLLCYLIGWTGLITPGIVSLPETVYGFSRLPVKVNLSSIAVIVACSMVICTLAAIYPAWRASRMNPVEALRYE